MYGVPHGRGANLLMYRTDQVKPAPDSWCGRLRRRVEVQGQGHGLRLADLHRRRRALPDEDPARPGDQEPVRARREAARRRGRPAQEAERRTSVSTGRTTSRRSRPSRTAPRVVGTTWQVIANRRAGREGAGRGGAAQGGRRPAGRTPGWWRAEEPSTKTCAYKLDRLPRLARRPTPQVAEYFGEAPATELACKETADTNHCDDLPRRGRGLLRRRSTTGRPRSRSAWTGATTCKCTDYAEWTQALVGDPRLRRGGRTALTAGTASRGERDWQQTKDAVGGAAGRADDCGSWWPTSGRWRRCFATAFCTHRPVHQRGRHDVHHGELPGSVQRRRLP